MSDDPQRPADGDAEPVTGLQPTADDPSSADAATPPVAGEQVDDATEQAADATVEQAPDTSAEATPDASPEEAPDASAEATPDASPEEAPDASAEQTPDASAEQAPETAREQAADATGEGSAGPGLAAAPEPEPEPEQLLQDDAEPAATPAAPEATPDAGGEPGAEEEADAVETSETDSDVDVPQREEPHRRTRRSHQPRAVDFSQPTKFTSEQQRRIARGLEGFCQTASTRLSSELRTPLELEVGPSAQIAWLMAQRQLPASSLAVTLEVEPLNTRMLLAADLRFVLVAVECLLGGAPERAPEERRLSEIDWALIRRLFDTIAAQLSAAWQDLARLSLRAGDIELQAEAVQIASVSEPTLVFKLLARIGDHPGNMSLLIPWQAIDPVAAAIGGRGALEEIEDADAVVAIEQALSGAKVTMRAEVAATYLGVEEVLALREGSLVTLGGRVDQGVSLVVEDRVIARAAPGRRGQRRAVQIVSNGDRR